MELKGEEMKRQNKEGEEIKETRKGIYILKMSLRVFIPVIKNYTPCSCKLFLSGAECSLSA